MAKRGKARNPNWVHPMSERMTLGQAGKALDLSLVAAKRSESARRYYRYAIDQFSEFLQEQGTTTPTLTDLTTLNVRSFSVWLGENKTYARGRWRSRGTSTVYSRMLALKILCKFLVDEGVLIADPLARVKLPRKPELEVQPFTPEEVRKLVDAVHFHGSERRNRAMIYLLLATGVRANELCTLTLAHLNLKAGTAIVDGKGTKERTVWFDQVTARYLAMWLAERPESAFQNVFLGLRAQPLSPSSLYSIIRRLADTAGVADAHPHKFRHTYATVWLELHPDMWAHLQDSLGHTRPEQTMRYAKRVRRGKVLDGPTNIEALHLNGRAKS